MKRRIVLALSMLCLSVYSWGQSSLQFLNSDPSRLPFENVWIVKYESAQTTGENVVLNLELRKDGRLIYEAKTEELQIVSRIQILDPSKVARSSESFLDGNVDMFVRNANALPSGHYTACVSLVGSGIQPLTSCLEFSVDGTYQIRLLHVPDGKKVENEKLPTFSWVFMSASLSRDDVRYEFTLCERLKGQSKEDALLRNVPLLKESSLVTTSLQYPIDAQKLEADKRYAWSVEAVIGSASIARSEAWGFSVRDQNESEEKKWVMPYLDIHSYRTGEILNISGEEFNLRFDHTANTKGEMVFAILDEKGNRLKAELEPVEISYGTNYVNLDLSTAKKLKHEKQYTLLIEDFRGEEIRIEFTYIKTR